MLLSTCSCAVVRCVLCALSGFAAPGGRCCLAPVRVPWVWPAACLCGVPRGPAWCAAPRPIRSLSVPRSAFPTPWCLSPPRGLVPAALLGGCAGHAEAGRERGSLCLPLAPAEAGALGSLRVVPVRGPVMGFSLGGPSSVSLGLRALRWLVCVDPVTDASGFPYHPSFNGDSAGAPGLFCVDADTSPFGPEDDTPGSCACVRVLVRLGRVGRAGLPGAFWCASPFFLAALSFCFARPPPGWGCPFLGLFFLFRAPPLSLAFLGFRHRVPSALAPCYLFLPPSPACVGFFFFAFLPSFCAPVDSGFPWFPAPDALGLGAVCC